MRLSTGTQRRLRITPRGSRRTALVPLLTAALLVVAAPAWAYWATLGAGAGTAVTANLSAPAPVTVVAGAGTAHLAWAASTLATGAPVTGSASSPVTGTSCDATNLRPGTYSWTVTAVYRSWTASAVSGSATVTAGAASTIAVSSGSGQSARVGTAFTSPL